MLKHQNFCLLFLIVCTTGSLGAQETPALRPYFQYSDDAIQKLEKLNSGYKFSKGELEKWDRYPIDLMPQERSFFDKLRIFTYLYAAQNDAAYLSQKASGNLTGSLDAISYEVFKLFLPTSPKPQDFQQDEYSNTLAEIVIKKVRSRKEKEDAQEPHVSVPEEYKDKFFVGSNCTAWIPWYSIPTKQYWPLSPDGINWEKQIEEIRKSQKSLTKEKKQAIEYWAGIHSQDDGDWRVIANRYLFSHQIPLEKMLAVRSVLMVGLYDGCIVSFQAKYGYMVLRPSMKDPSLQTQISVPKHPSYPSNHSVTSTIAATILSHFFPADSQHWHELANEAGLSRIWGAIHYPVDDEQGVAAGKKIADSLLQQMNQSN